MSTRFFFQKKYEKAKLTSEERIAKLRDARRVCARSKKINKKKYTGSVGGIPAINMGHAAIHTHALAHTHTHTHTHTATLEAAAESHFKRNQKIKKIKNKTNNTHQSPSTWSTPHKHKTHTKHTHNTRRAQL